MIFFFSVAAVFRLLQPKHGCKARGGVRSSDSAHAAARSVQDAYVEAQP
jgi:hypothetical protein